MPILMNIYLIKSTCLSIYCRPHNNAQYSLQIKTSSKRLASNSGRPWNVAGGGEVKIVVFTLKSNALMQ